MIIRWKKTAALFLGLCLLTACTPDKPAASSTTAPPVIETTSTPEPVSTPEPTTAAQEAVRVAVLKGPTGLGAAHLMDQAANGTAQGDYTFSVLAEPTQAVASLSGGEGTADIAALPTNLASALYHKTDGGIQLLALNTLGVLYILENGDTVNELSDLAGKTIYATGQGANPEYVLNYLLERDGLTPGQDVTIEWKASDELTALMASGEIALCMLPVPAATSVLLQNQQVRKAVSLTEAWEESGAEGALTMGCLAVRTAFAQAHPQAVEQFLEEYEASIDFMKEDSHLDEAAQLAETYGIVPKAAVAKAALPDANLIYEDGEDMITDIQGYYQVLFDADPSSIGGSMPDAAFYYSSDS